MNTPQRLPVALTPLDPALAMMRDSLAPVQACDLDLAEALDCVAAEMPALAAVPAKPHAAIDGWAFRANDLVGASSYTPLTLGIAPAWVDAGGPLPDGCDCIIDAGLVEQVGSLSQVLGEAIPGQGVRRAGGDIGEGSFAIVAGQKVRPIDLMVARAAGLSMLAVRRPRVCVIDSVASGRNSVTAHLIAEQVQSEGAYVIRHRCDSATLSAMFRSPEAEACDLIITVGGTGVGRGDRTVHALSQCGVLLVHGIALQPGRTTAIGQIKTTPVVALPGAPDQAMGAWWALVLPVLDRLSGRTSRPIMTLPLTRKIASGVGIAELVLLKAIDGAWMPLATGDISLDQIAHADAWCLVPAGSEGFAASARLGGYMIRE